MRFCFFFCAQEVLTFWAVFVPVEVVCTFNNIEKLKYLQTKHPKLKRLYHERWMRVVSPPVWTPSRIQWTKIIAPAENRSIKLTSQVQSLKKSIGITIVAHGFEMARFHYPVPFKFTGISAIILSIYRVCIMSDYARLSRLPSKAASQKNLERKKRRSKLRNTTLHDTVFK